MEIQQFIADLCFLERGEGLSVSLLPQSLGVLLQGHVWVRRPARVGVCRALKCITSLNKGKEEKRTTLLGINPWREHQPEYTESIVMNSVQSGYMFECLLSNPTTFLFIFKISQCSPVPLNPPFSSWVWRRTIVVLPLQFHLWSKCQACFEKHNLQRHKGGLGLHTTWKLTLCNLRWSWCITTGQHFHCSYSEAKQFSFLHKYNIFSVWKCQVETEKEIERNINDPWTLYNISGVIHFTWSGYSFQHIHHSCTVTWLCWPSSRHPYHNKNRSLLGAYCTVQQRGRQPELLFSSVWVFNLYNNPTYSLLAVLF